MPQPSSKGMGDPKIAVTTAEALERRHLVRPYEEQPVLQFTRGAVTCVFCGNPGFRRSRLRISDLGELLLLRYPLRCTRCGQRQYNGVHVAFLAYGPRKVLLRPEQETDAWQNWTATGNGQKISHSMSTAVAPHAQRSASAQTDGVLDSSSNTENPR